MKAVLIHGYDTAPILTEVARPVPGAGEVLVRVRAAALNPLDVKLRRGFMHQFFPLKFPYALGTDIAGEIEEIGRQVEGWRPGDHVIARLDPVAGGGAAQFAVVPSSQLVKAPATLGLEEAAGIPTAAGTAWQALFEIAALRRDQTILIHAGVGGVGSFAIQFARSVGAHVVATASGAGMEIARQLGADRIIDYRDEDFAATVSDLDVVLDTIGGETQQRSFGVLRAGGILIATSEPPDEALAKAHGVVATFVFHSCDAARLQQVVEAIEANRMKVLLDRKVALDGFETAFAHQASGRARGKIILSMDEAASLPSAETEPDHEHKE